MTTPTPPSDPFYQPPLGIGPAYDVDSSRHRRLAGRFAALMAMVTPTRPPTDDPDAATARGEEEA